MAHLDAIQVTGTWQGTFEGNVSSAATAVATGLIFRIFRAVLWGKKEWLRIFLTTQGW